VKIFLGIILLLVNSGCIFEKSGRKLPKNFIFNEPMKEFKIENETIDEVFQKLNSHYMPRIIVEFYITDEPYYKDYKNKIPAKPINIDLKNTTVKEVIKEALKQDPRCTIKEMNDYFIITQKALINKKDYLLVDFRTFWRCQLAWYGDTARAPMKILQILSAVPRHRTMQKPWWL